MKKKIEEAASKLNWKEAAFRPKGISFSPEEIKDMLLKIGVDLDDRKMVNLHLKTFPINRKEREAFFKSLEK